MSGSLDFRALPLFATVLGFILGRAARLESIDYFGCEYLRLRVPILGFHAFAASLFFV